MEGQYYIQHHSIETKKMKNFTSLLFLSCAIILSTGHSLNIHRTKRAVFDLIPNVVDENRAIGTTCKCLDPVIICFLKGNKTCVNGKNNDGVIVARRQKKREKLREIWRMWLENREKTSH